MLDVTSSVDVAGSATHAVLAASRMAHPKKMVLCMAPCCRHKWAHRRGGIFCDEASHAGISRQSHSARHEFGELAAYMGRHCHSTPRDLPSETVSLERVPPSADPRARHTMMRAPARRASPTPSKR